MAAKAICDVCKKEEVIETTPMGLATMPITWFCTVRSNDKGDLDVVDVCSDTCALAFDKSTGVTPTILDGVEAEK